MPILRREGSRQMVIKWGMRTGWIDHFRVFFFSGFLFLNTSFLVVSIIFISNRRQHCSHYEFWKVPPPLCRNPEGSTQPPFLCGSYPIQALFFRNLPLSGLFRAIRTTLTHFYEMVKLLLKFLSVVSVLFFFNLISVLCCIWMAISKEGSFCLLILMILFRYDPFMSHKWQASNFNQ